ncbi:MAG TPA: SPOR domain-containing protein [Bryobacteraceae bacterium]|nr:SPOR domain-containing protein [Bryobacteraceae bacterium]
MLALFFGLVALCAVFFAMGYKLGKSSASNVLVEATPGGAAASTITRTTTEKPTATSPDLAFYKSEPKNASAPASEETASATSEQATNSAENKPADLMTPPPLNGYYVQVAAVTKQEDADALVDALKKKQYAAFSSALADKLFHVQVGPFSDVKSAEDARAKLIIDGYNPILKK